MSGSRLIHRISLPAACMLVCGIGISIVLAYVAYRQEQRIEQAEFERHAQLRMTDVEEGVSDATDALQVVQHLFASHAEVTRAQFQAFARPLRVRYPYIEAIAFNRRVSAAQRPAFEARRRAEFPGYRITELRDGQRVPAAEKEHYRVIDYVEPVAGNEAVLGFDASSTPFQDAAIRRAEETGLPTATGLYPLLRDPSGTQRGLQLIKPVYRGTALSGDASRRQLITGYIVVLLRADMLFDRILASAGEKVNAGLDIRIYQTDSADDGRLVYRLAGAVHEARQWWQPAWLRDARLEPVSRSFHVGGTLWHIVVASQPRKLTVAHGSALLVLVTGLLATLAATAYMRACAMRTRRIEQVVAERTRQLQQVNDQLIGDIAARERAEKALASSEERARELAELGSDWFWELDEHFCFTRHAPGTSDHGSGRPSVLLGTSLWALPTDRDSADFGALRALLDARLPFKHFEYKRLIDGCAMQWVSASGKPIFDQAGHFRGYRGTATNIHARKTAEEALRESQQALRQLAGHLQQVREDERKRIARDIHDDLGQNLMVLRIDVARMAAHPDSMPTTQERIAQALRQVDTTIRAVRAIINDLRPQALDLGLSAAIEWLASDFEQRSGIPCDLQLDLQESVLDDHSATALFRIVQEALMNVARHAHAGKVCIHLCREHDRVLMRIADDGIGFDPRRAGKPNAFGLLGMQERVAALGGTVSIVGVPGRGVTIHLSIPVAGDADSAALHSP